MYLQGLQKGTSGQGVLTGHPEGEEGTAGKGVRPQQDEAGIPGADESRGVEPAQRPAWQLVEGAADVSRCLPVRPHPSSVFLCSRCPLLDFPLVPLGCDWQTGG